MVRFKTDERKWQDQAEMKENRLVLNIACHLMCVKMKWKKIILINISRKLYLSEKRNNLITAKIAKMCTCFPVINNGAPLQIISQLSLTCAYLSTLSTRSVTSSALTGLVLPFSSARHSKYDCNQRLKTDRFGGLLFLSVP